MEAFHLKYRPATLGRLIGHEQITTRLQGMINSNKIPNALLFVGPSSAGKTTMARAFAADLNGVKSVDDLGTDYREINGTDQRSIEDIRSLIQQSRFKPRHKKRVIVVDEFQGILSNAPAAAALLKPLEEPSKDTLWILCTMDPAKLGSGNGRAIANRCTQFVLNEFSSDELRKQAQRIIKREDMKYAIPALDQIVNSCNGEMRTLANLIQAANQYYEGLKKKPKRLSDEDIANIVATNSANDDTTAVKVMLAIYQLDFATVQRALLDVEDGFRFVSLLLNANMFLLNSSVLKGEKHRKLAWWSKTNKDLSAAVKKNQLKLSIRILAMINEMLVDCKIQSTVHALPPEELLSARLFSIIRTIEPMVKK